MSADLWAMQKAVFAALAADAGVRAELGDPPRLYDDPPATAAFPYALVGEARAAPYPGLDGGVEHDIRVQIVSRGAGRREIKRILEACARALDEADLAIDGRRLVNLRFVSAEVFRRDGADIYQGLARFRAVTEAA